VSKSMIVAAADAGGAPVMAWLLTIASVGTFLSVGLKLPALVFGGRSDVGVVQPVPPGMLIAMTLTGALCVLLGVAPGLLYQLLPYAVTYVPYTAAHVVETLELMAGTMLAFVLARRALAGKATDTMDVDLAYRAAGRAVVRAARGVEMAAAALESAAFRLVSPGIPVRRLLAGPVGYAVLAAVAALGGFLTVLR
jgi:multicomponent Na+:H+ antiporter subunit D